MRRAGIRMTMSDVPGSDMPGSDVPGPAVLLMLTACSPAFPTGGYAYSQGLEWAVEAGDIQDEATALDWIGTLLTHGSGRSDALLLRHAHRGEDVAELAEAVAGTRERRAETVAQGTAFALAGQVWGGGEATVAYPIAMARLMSARGVPEDLACTGLLHALAANLVSAAVRLVPLGQTAGLRILQALEPVILALVADTREAGLDEVGGACFRSDIAAARHETQHTRLFRS